MYRATIGLEIHAELATATKMFCGCKNDPNERIPNTNVCAICLAHPGTLPVINKEAVRKVLRVGAALGSSSADYSEFDRKNYFYPDIPKGYQISQYKHPLVVGGALQGIAITRVHLEEDTARSQHVADPDKGGEGNKSLVDFNRAGVPLMELVTEPVIHDAQTAGAFARELQLLLRYLGAGEANMEKGEMRVEANISVSRLNLDEPGGSKVGPLGTKVEVKNLNSFRSVERAIAYEIERQTALLQKGEVVTQETRGWDENTNQTFSQRKKESSHDYRYFPDPDLPKLKLSEIPDFSAEILKKEMPELPWEKRGRYLALGLKKDDVEMYVRNEGFDITGEIKMTGIGNYFEECLVYCGADKDLISLVSNYLSSDIPGLVKKLNTVSTGAFHINFPDAKHFVALVALFKKGDISSRVAKDVLEMMLKEDGDPVRLIAEKRLMQQSDPSVLEDIARKVVGENPQSVADYKAGKQAALQFLVGQGMKESKGSANPQTLREAIENILA